MMRHPFFYLIISGLTEDPQQTYVFGHDKCV